MFIRSQTHPGLCHSQQWFQFRLHEKVQNMRKTDAVILKLHAVGCNECALWFAVGCPSGLKNLICLLSFRRTTHLKIILQLHIWRKYHVTAAFLVRSNWMPFLYNLQSECYAAASCVEVRFQVWHCSHHDSIWPSSAIWLTSLASVHLECKLYEAYMYVISIICL